MRRIFLQILRAALLFGVDIIDILDTTPLPV